MSIMMFYVFPNGRFEPRWTRWTAGGLALLFEVRTLQFVSPIRGRDLDRLFSPLILAVFASCIVAQVYRYRRLSTPVERQQTKWVIFGLSVGGILCTAGKGATSLLHPNGPAWTLFSATSVSIAVTLIPISVLMAMLRYRLWDIDVVINRTLVYGALTLVVVGLYAVLATGLNALLPTSSFLVSLATTGLVAVIFAPLRGRLQRTVRRLMYGGATIHTWCSRGLVRLQAGLAPDAVLGNMVDTLSHSLRLPYAAIALAGDKGSSIVAARGRSSGAGVYLPLVYQGSAVGEIILSPRAPGEAFTPADFHLLHGLARHVSVAACAVQLTDDLQRSREGLVIAREEERRRLRRDLHDDLAPTQESIALTAGAPADLIAHEPETAADLVRELEAEIHAAVGGIRRLVYDLRPPALDELGLVGAVRERVMHLGRTDGLRIALEAPDSLPPPQLPVEVAAFRIVQEALSNVVCHAHAHTCTVRITITDALEVEVTDDGVGLPRDKRPGVGLRSMRERAEELGGLCSIESGRGTRLRARLPLPRE